MQKANRTKKKNTNHSNNIYNNSIGLWLTKKMAKKKDIMEANEEKTKPKEDQSNNVKSSLLSWSASLRCAAVTKTTSEPQLSIVV